MVVINSWCVTIIVQVTAAFARAEPCDGPANEFQIEGTPARRFCAESRASSSAAARKPPDTNTNVAAI